MFRNKHIIIAMLAAPVLAILAWVATDQMVGEEPEQAQAGGHYKLAGQSNCRYSSGECTLRNGNFEIEVRAEPSGPEQVRLTIDSRFPLQGAKAAWTMDPESEDRPGSLSAVNGDQHRWEGEVPAEGLEDATLRLALQANDAWYYSETGTRFMDYETAFGEDFRRE